jgi:hypothetical protein
MTRSLEAKKLLFIAGAHKSGTSIFHRCIRDHPEISGFEGTGVPEDEGQLLQTVFPAAKKFGGMGRFGFNPDAEFLEDHPLVSPSNAEALIEQWSPHWDLSRSVLVEKSPPTIIRARFFQALFPEQSHFVLLMRHPISVSYSTGRWTEQPLEELIEHWLVLHERFEERQRAGLRRLMVVRYEDFCRDAQSVIEKVWSFVGLEPVPLQREVRQGIDDKYFRRWNRMGWTPWGRKRRNQIISRLENRLEDLDYGYSLLKAP